VLCHRRPGNSQSSVFSSPDLRDRSRRFLAGERLLASDSSRVPKGEHPLELGKSAFALDVVIAAVLCALSNVVISSRRLKSIFVGGYLAPGFRYHDRRSLARNLRDDPSGIHIGQESNFGNLGLVFNLGFFFPRYKIFSNPRLATIIELV